MGGRKAKGRESMKRVMIFRVIALVVFVVLMVTGKPVLWLAGFVVSLALATRYGRLYCGYLCPINTVITPIDKIQTKCKKPRRTTPSWMAKGWLPWLALIASAALALLTARAKGRPFPVLALWMVVAALMTLSFRAEVFHNAVCPYGALQQLAGRYAKRGHWVDPSTCQGHKECERVCPAEAVRYDPEKGYAQVNPALCHQCGRCAQACPTRSIRYAKERAG